MLCIEVLAAAKDFEFPSLDVDLHQVGDRTTIRNKAIQRDCGNRDELAVSTRRTKSSSLNS